VAILKFHITPTGGCLSNKKKSGSKRVISSAVDWYSNRTATDEYIGYEWIAHYYSLEPSTVKRDYRLQNTFDDNE